MRLREVTTNEQILAINSLIKESNSFCQEDIYPDTAIDQVLVQLNRELGDLSSELEISLPLKTLINYF